MSIDTACSSSLVAFHQACLSILSGEADHALTGGISLHLHPFGFITFSKASMLSRRGLCNVFDAAGDGYVRSEGGGLFLLKGYDQAVADGDRILAVVAASAVNTDGHKSGLTVPSADIQAALLHRAYALAGIEPSAIDYVEAHGTGTAIGDPIEALALGTALGQQRPSGHPLPIGSVKSNLGHLEPAAGVAGLVKSLLCIQHRTIPATTGISVLNPAIPFDDLNLTVVRKNRPLKAQGKIVIGVNSFGFGGANAHVILEGTAPDFHQPADTRNTATLPVMISAKDVTALRIAARELAGHLQGNPQADLYDIAYHALFRRDWLKHRALIFAAERAACIRELQAFADGLPSVGAIATNSGVDAASGPAFIYSGNGSQWFGMGKTLLNDPLFRKTIQAVDTLFSRYAEWSIEAELCGENSIDRYEYTEIAQPALFAIQVGMTRMLEEYGVRPVAVAGHSVGEIAAAWASGALTLEAAVQVIYHRSQLQGATKGQGQMTAVGLGLQGIMAILAETGLSGVLSLAGSNSPKGVTVAGLPEHLERLETVLSERAVFNRRLALDYAFHSPAMDPLESGLLETLGDLPLGATRVPFYSTVSGGPHEGSGLGAAYWWHNIRKPVMFEPAIRQMIVDGINVFIEIGPNAILRNYVNDCLQEAGVQGRIITTGLRGQDAPHLVWSAAGQAIIAGVPVEWETFFPHPGAFVELPHYPWQRERHWHPVTPDAYGLLYRRKLHPLLGYHLPQQELAWENHLDSLAIPSLADHVVDGATVFPGAGFAELALAAAMQWQPGNFVEVENLEIRSPLLLGDKHSKVIRLSIDPTDGRFMVKSRELGSADAWDLHAIGRIIREAQTLDLTVKPMQLPCRDPDFTAVDHNRLTAAVGLEYGPSYQMIEHGWVENDTAFGQLRSPEELAADVGEYHLHPALLDCTFQLILPLLRELQGDSSNSIFVPVAIGRIILRGRGAIPRRVSATLLRRGPHSLTAEFALFDADGNTVAVVKQVRFRALPIRSQQTGKQPDFLEYRGIPSPHVLSPYRASIPFSRLHQKLAKAVEAAADAGFLRPYAEGVEPLLTALGSRFVIEAMEKLTGDGTLIGTGALDDVRLAHPELDAFYEHLLAMAIGPDLIVPDAANYRNSSDPHRSATSAELWNHLISIYPYFFQLAQSVAKVGLRLAPLLAGEASGDPISPPATLAPFITQLLGADHSPNLDLALRDVLSEVLETLPIGQRLRIVEINEGPPMFAASLVQGLDFSRSDYLFVTPSADTAEECGNLCEQFPAFEIRHLATEAMETTPIAGLPHDLAIVTCDFATVETALAALRFACNQLADNGLLVFMAQHPSPWIDFVFGAASEWWGTMPGGERVSRQQSADCWQQRLEQSGFTAVEQIDLCSYKPAGPYLLIARRAAKAAVATADKVAADPDFWVLVTDAQGYSSELAHHLRNQLEDRGDRVLDIAPKNRGEFAAELGQCFEEHGRPRGVVHLAGLHTVNPESPASFHLDTQVDRCAIVADIMRACETSPSTCWLITTGAASHLLPSYQSSVKDKSLSTLADAALWGFGRTLLNEVDAEALRLIDLESSMSAETAAVALIKELAQPDDEQEIILTAAGERFVPRLYKVPRPCLDSVNAGEPGESCFSLSFQTPGQLRNLRWQTQPCRLPDVDEVEIEVDATGLNFRDFMYTLGLLSDEAVENGFAGPTLGLEFAGRVIRAGVAVRDFTTGDRVLGFGPSSFGNRVITKASAVSPIPTGLCPEAAATIPAAFFTAYYALHHLGHLARGEKVLIHGAAGGVGLAAIQVAQWCGAEIYATAGSDDKRDFLRLLGIEHIFDSRSLDFAEEILSRTGGEGIDVVLNSLSGEAINRNLRVLKPFGRFLELGKRDFYENTRIGLRPFRNNISYFGIDADQLMKVHSSLTSRLFREILELFNQGIFHPLPYTAFDANEIVAAFRHMQHSRQIGKIVVTYQKGITNPHRVGRPVQPILELPEDATFLIVGGLNGLGLKTAEWLAAKGTRHLLLISRSGPTSEEAIETITRLERAGVKVHAAACDVTDRHALSALLEEASHILPPLRGVVHSAMVIDDGLIRNLSPGQIRRVVAPKLLGALHLHELTLQMPLDYFIIYSSGTTLFGNPCQGNYVAANTWLEALVSHRRKFGLPATCIGLGAIDDVGYLARHEQIKETLQTLMGGAAITSTSALAALETMLCANVSGYGVLDLDWSSLNRFLPRASTPKFRELARRGGGSSDQQESKFDLQRMIADLPEEKLLEAVINLLKEDVGKVLRMAPNNIDKDLSLHDMGLDSLMGVELAVAVESRFGTKLPAMVLSEKPTITKLAEYLLGQHHAALHNNQIDAKKEL